jgi:Tfp pilus assembly protein PilW
MRQHGLTLVELLLTIVVGGFVIAGVFRLLTTTNRSLSAQEQLVDVNLNSDFSIEYLSEVLSEAGADLPSDGFNAVITRPSLDSTSDTVIVRSNPAGGRAYSLATLASSGSATKIPVANASSFFGADSLALELVPGNVAVTRLTSVDTASTPDSLLVTSLPSNITTFTQVFAYKTDKYFRAGAKYICINDTGSIIAENITRLYFRYVDMSEVDGRKICPWDSVKFARITLNVQSDNGRKIKTKTGFVTFRNR